MLWDIAASKRLGGVVNRCLAYGAYGGDEASNEVESETGCTSVAAIKRSHVSFLYTNPSTIAACSTMKPQRWQARTTVGMLALR